MKNKSTQEFQSCGEIESTQEFEFPAELTVYYVRHKKGTDYCQPGIACSNFFEFRNKKNKKKCNEI